VTVRLKEGGMAFCDRRDEILFFQEKTMKKANSRKALYAMAVVAALAVPVSFGLLSAAFSSNSSALMLATVKARDLRNLTAFRDDIESISAPVKVTVLARHGFASSAELEKSLVNYRGELSLLTAAASSSSHALNAAAAFALGSSGLLSWIVLTYATQTWWRRRSAKQATA
jgi:hypothetical protein